MQKQPPDETQFLEYQANLDDQTDPQHVSPEAAIQRCRKQHFFIKLTLSIILVIMATVSVQTKMQYYGPFVRTVQNFFNYHLLQHESQDIYQGGDVMYYRTQQYFMAHDIMAFFKRYEDTMTDRFHRDSFFFAKKHGGQMTNERHHNEIVKILVISEVEEDRASQEQSSTPNNKNYFSKTLKQQNAQQSPILFRNRIFITKREHQWIVQRPLHQIRQFFNLTVFNKTFYQTNLKRIQLQTSLDIGFKNNQNCTVEVKTTCVFYSGMMMAVKIDTRVLESQAQVMLQSQQQDQQFNDTNLGIRKLSEFHNLNFDFKYMGYVIFAVNSLLFCLELMVVIRTNRKIEENLDEQREFERQMAQIIQLRKVKNSPKAHAQNHLQIDQDSFMTFAQEKMLHQLIEENQTAAVKQLSYKERLEIIGIYNILELVLSFLVLITVNHKGLVCLWCWAKISVYMSQTGNRMMFGFLFKKAIPAYLKVIFNLSIWLSGFVFFSMVTYTMTKKFQSTQLAYYEYIFNYFQYGIFENFRPIARSGSMYSFLYFLQMAFLVMIGNNILQSILAQQVLKNSNMQDLIEFIEEIEVECPVCGCPPEVKKKIKLKLAKQNERQNRFISQYFETQNKEAVNKSKYEIKILSPEFSPMFHKSQYKKKQFKLRKRSMNNISIVGQESMIDSPPLSPMPLSPKSPRSPYTPATRALQQQKKKVKIEIGGEIQEKKMTKFEQFSKDIKTKSEIVNKILHQLPRQHKQINSSLGKSFHIQFLKKKIEEIKQITAKMK